MTLIYRASRDADVAGSDPVSSTAFHVSLAPSSRLFLSLRIHLSYWCSADS